VIALQSTTTNGPSGRPLASWIARAASSLPVPDSPSISTVASVGDAISSTAKQLAHRHALARHRTEVIVIAGRQRDRLGGRDPHRRGPELHGGTRRDHHLSYLGALPPRAVGRAEVLDPDPSGTAVSSPCRRDTCGSTSTRSHDACAPTTTGRAPSAIRRTAVAQD